MISRLLCIGFLILNVLSGKAQLTFTPDTTILVINSGQTLYNAWAGGINSGQISKMDLNGDKIDDLVIFDRYSNRLSTYLATKIKGQYSWRFAPFYQKFFPDMSYWMLLRDYNKDGQKDIFTRGSIGVRVLKNISTGTLPKWEVVKDPLYSQGYSGLVNLYTNPFDLISIIDVDNDGDLDILNWEPFLGAQVEYHRNNSQEYYGNSDSLVFSRANDCWGGFQENYCYNSYTFGLNCSTGLRNTSTLRTTHVGCGTLLALDMDDDGDKDLLCTKVNCGNINLLINEGTPQNAVFTHQDSIFPKNTVRLDFLDLPAPFFEDIDFDGIRDLVACQDQYYNTSGAIDFKHSLWLYKNTGINSRPTLAFQQKDFLQNSMIDVGELGMPAFADFDGDGDLDLFIGEYRLKAGGFSSMQLYENFGTATHPAFTLLDTNYLNLNTQGYEYLRPMFVDLNADHAEDLLLITNTQSNNSEIKFILNSGGPNQPFLFKGTPETLPVSLQPYDAPCLYDVDHDRDLDLILAKARGNLRFYRNTGSPSTPIFSLENDSLGGIGIAPNNQSVYPSIGVTDIDSDGKPDLLSANNMGQIVFYPDFLNHYNKHFEVKQIVSDSIFKSQKPSIALVDLNQDGKPEIVGGVATGGIFILKNDSSGHFLPPQVNISISISPNPTQSSIKISSSEDYNIDVFSSTGVLVRTGIKVRADIPLSIELSSLESGLYLVRFSNGPQQIVKKLVVIN